MQKRSGTSKPSPEPAASRRQRRRLEAEARIMAAAEQIFAETGFSGATTSMIAAKARLPKANVHYYFRTKERLYHAVLTRILDAWLHSGDVIRPEADPATAFAAYVAAKIEASRQQPYASKVFANEILHGAPQVRDYLADQVRRWVDRKAKVIDGWIARGRMRPVEAPHLFFVLWAATQTYADFETQMRAVLKRKCLLPRDYQAATALVTRMVLGACGLRIPPGCAGASTGARALKTRQRRT